MDRPAADCAYAVIEAYYTRLSATARAVAGLKPRDDHADVSALLALHGRHAGDQQLISRVRERQSTARSDRAFRDLEVPRVQLVRHAQRILGVWFWEQLLRTPANLMQLVEFDADYLYLPEVTYVLAERGVRRTVELEADDRAALVSGFTRLFSPSSPQGGRPATAPDRATVWHEYRAIQRVLRDCRAPRPVEPDKMADIVGLVLMDTPEGIAMSDWPVSKPFWAGCRVCRPGSVVEAVGLEKVMLMLFPDVRLTKEGNAFTLPEDVHVDARLRGNWDDIVAEYGNRHYATVAAELLACRDRVGRKTIQNLAAGPEPAAHDLAAPESDLTRLDANRRWYLVEHLPGLYRSFLPNSPLAAMTELTLSERQALARPLGGVFPKPR